jgi:beta-galactosidase
MNKRSHTILLLGLTVTALFTLLNNAHTAATTTPASLNGTDIYNGLRGKSFNEGWKFHKGDVAQGQKTTFDDSAWETLTLPHDWSIFNDFNEHSAARADGGYLDGGIGWYRKTFSIPADYKNKKVFVEFDGAYMNSQV